MMSNLEKNNNVLKYRSDFQYTIRSIFDVLANFLTIYMMRRFFLSGSRWEMLRSHVTPMERKQYGCLKQIPIENRFSYRNHGRFAVYRQLKNGKGRTQARFLRPIKAKSVTLDSKFILWVSLY